MYSRTKTILWSILPGEHRRVSWLKLFFFAARDSSRPPGPPRKITVQNRYQFHDEIQYIFNTRFKTDSSTGSWTGSGTHAIGSKLRSRSSTRQSRDHRPLHSSQAVQDFVVQLVTSTRQISVVLGFLGVGAPPSLSGGAISIAIWDGRSQGIFGIPRIQIAI
jgi:hypothetical protein